MTSRVYILTLGLIAISAIVAAVVAGDRDVTNAVSGLIAIAAGAVGALATMANYNKRSENPVVGDTYTFEPIPPPTPPPPPPSPPPIPGGEGAETKVNWPKRDE